MNLQMYVVFVQGLKQKLTFETNPIFLQSKELGYVIP